jgi:hypothetical protein
MDDRAIQRKYVATSHNIAFQLHFAIRRTDCRATITFGAIHKTSFNCRALAMIALVFCSTAIQQWEAIPSQLIHIAFIAFLLAFLDQNTYVLDKRFSISKK